MPKTNRNPHFLPVKLLGELDGFIALGEGKSIAGSALEATLSVSQEAALQAPWCYLAARPSIGRWRYLRINGETMQVDEVSVVDLSLKKESLVSIECSGEMWPL